MKTKKIDLTAIGGILVFLFLVLSSGYLEYSGHKKDCIARYGAGAIECKGWL